VWDAFRRWADRDGNAEYRFVGDDGSLSRIVPSALMAQAGSAAAHLAALGVTPGDRVGICARNHVAYPAVLGAVAAVGAIAVPLNALLTPSELAYQLHDVEPRAVVAQDSLVASTEAAVELAGVHPVRFTLGEHADRGWEPIDVAGGAFEPPGRADPMAPFEILFTSGTTSRPKGVMLSHRSVLEEALRQIYQWSLRPDDVVFCHLPLFHVGGQGLALFPALVGGATLAIGGAFSASRWPADLRSTGATIAILAGPQIRMIMAQPGQPSDSDNQVRLVPCGLAVPEGMERRFIERFGAPVRAVSGSTESVAVSYSEPVFGEHRHPALGRPTIGKEVAVLDEHGVPVPYGVPGELCVRGEPGAELMLGYWNRPEETAGAIVDGWLHTGDIGIMDEDGFVFFVDRKKDIIKRSGENVSASEVEAVLFAVAGVREAAVVGRPDPIRDEAVVAFVALDDDGPPVETLEARCRAELAAFKVPEEFIVLDHLPVTSIGKIEKNTLRQMARGAVSATAAVSDPA
jgi:crotonobetaine/carnitine-CoA ligase